MKELHPFMFVLLLLTVFNACKKDENPRVALEVATGYAYLYDINRIKGADHSGITIGITDSISTTTKSDGNWIISHIKSGTYTIVFSKPDFGTMKVVGRKLFGGYTALDPISLYPIPLYNVTLSSDSVSSDGQGIYLYGFFSGPVPSVPFLHLFFGKDINVSSDPSTYKFDFVFNLRGAVENVDFGIAFQTVLFTDKGFNSGDKVYIVAYTDCLVAASYNSDTAIWYNDMNTNKKVYPNLNPTKSNVLNFVLP